LKRGIDGIEKVLEKFGGLPEQRKQAEKLRAL